LQILLLSADADSKDVDLMQSILEPDEMISANLSLTSQIQLGQILRERQNPDAE
jgi:hypothetical protein